MGILQITGQIDLSQFWPSGTSDADTVKVLVKGDASFKFQTHRDKSFKTTKVFQGAKVKGQGTASVISQKGEVKVRLQGADAPELHYRPVLSKGQFTEKQKESFKEYNEEFRQQYGETAAMKLYELLAKEGKKVLPCIVETQVDYPNEVCDTYGRIVGDVIVVINKKKININHWLVENGYAFPTFYSSMSREELLNYIRLTKKARSLQKNIWPKYYSEFKSFDFKSVFRKGGEPDFASDNKKPIHMPKLFRRFATYSAMKKAKIVSYGFASYLLDTKDYCFETSEFLEQGASAAERYVLSDYMKGIRFLGKPEDLVFVEKPSTLISAKGAKIEAW